MKLPQAFLLSLLAHAAGFAALMVQKSRVPFISARQGDAILLMGVPGGTSRQEQSSAGPGSGKNTAPARQGGLYTGTASELMKAIEYPEQAVLMEMEGYVDIEVQIGPEGRPENARVVRSSGHAILDEAARSGVLRWTFTDAENRTIKIPFRFRLQ